MHKHLVLTVVAAIFTGAISFAIGIQCILRDEWCGPDNVGVGAILAAIGVLMWIGVLSWAIARYTAICTKRKAESQPIPTEDKHIPISEDELVIQ